jgi:hypothetical protein
MDTQTATLRADWDHDDPIFKKKNGMMVRDKEPA